MTDNIFTTEAIRDPVKWFKDNNPAEQERKPKATAPNDALNRATNTEPAPLYYRVNPEDTTETPVILEQGRGQDSFVDQYRDSIEATQAVARKAAEEAKKIAADPDLSAEGKAKRVAEVNRAAMKELAQVADDLNAHDGVIREQVAEPLQYVESYQPNDPATPMLDLALVQAFKAMEGHERTNCVARMIDGNDQRMADAILRLPTVLTGLSSTTLGHLRDAAVNRMHPAESAQRRNLAVAASAAREMIDRTQRHLATAGRLSRQEQRELLGDAAQYFPHLFS